MNVRLMRSSKCVNCHQMPQLITVSSCKEVEPQTSFELVMRSSTSSWASLDIKCPDNIEAIVARELCTIQIFNNSY